MAENVKYLRKELARLNTALYGWGGAAKNMKNYKPESNRYQRAKIEYDKIKPEYDAVLAKLKAAEAAEKKKEKKESAAKKIADAIKDAKEDIEKADARLTLAADLNDPKLFDEAKALREKATKVLSENKVGIPAEPLITTPTGSKFKPQEPIEIEAEKAGEGSGKYDKYVLNPDGIVTGEGRQQYLVTIKNLKTGQPRQQPFTSPIEAREAFIKEYYSGPGDAEKLKAQLKAKGFINDTDIADGTWYTGIDDFILGYTRHAISQVKYGGAENSDSISSYFNTVKNMGAGSGISSKTYKVITKRSDAKKDLDGYLIELIGRPATMQEEENYFNQLNKAENESTQTTTDGTTVGRVLQDSDRMLIAASVAKKSLKGMDVEELLSSKKGSQVAVDITEVQKLASRYGIPMDAVKALSYVRAGLGTKDALVKQEERLRQLSIQMHPYLKDHLMAGGTVKDVADVYATAKLQKLGVAVPDSTADASVMAAVRQGKTIDQYNQELQADPLWRKSAEARNTATQFANTILSSFGFGG